MVLEGSCDPNSKEPLDLRVTLNRSLISCMPDKTSQLPARSQVLLGCYSRVVGGKKVFPISGQGTAHCKVASSVMHPSRGWGPSCLTFSKAYGAEIEVGGSPSSVTGTYVFGPLSCYPRGYSNLSRKVCVSSVAPDRLALRTQAGGAANIWKS